MLQDGTNKGLFARVLYQRPKSRFLSGRQGICVFKCESYSILNPPTISSSLHQKVGKCQKYSLYLWIMSDDQLMVLCIYSLFNFVSSVKMEPEEVDPQKLRKQQQLWKIFGRETKAGKEMFDLYNIAEKPKINYPKPKPKSQKEIDAEKQKLAATKKCPQKTEIQYPDLPKPERPVLHPVDLIPKRKNESVIRKEIEQYYERRAKDIPANRGVDRANLVRKLQEKFKMQRGILPKGAQLPGLDVQTKFDEQLIKNNAKLKADKKGQSYSQPLKKQQKQRKDLKDELEELFDQVVAEIDERQRYLESIEHLQQPALKEKIKKEMIQRVAELQRITQMKR